MATANEIFEHHLEVFAAGDIDGILSDFSDASVMIFDDRIWRGLDGARAFFHMWIDDLLPPGCRFDLIERVATDDMVCITWTAESPQCVFDFGTDTFVVRDGKFWRQTVAGSWRRK